MKLQNQIKALQAFCEARYNQGYDVFVECYAEAEWIEFLTDYDGTMLSMKQAKNSLLDIIAHRKEMQAEANSYIDRYDYREDSKVIETEDNNTYLAEDCDYSEDDDAPREPMIFLPHPCDNDIPF
jgi:hypothetical protein